MAYNTTKIKAIKSYPTYQLHAESLHKMIPTQDIFKVCILETFAWIRSRLEGFDIIPNQFDMPSVENYVQLNLDDLYSFSVDAGFTVDVVYVRSQKIWSFSITEPDNGANIGRENERTPVYGRTFSTDISFRLKEKSVEVAVRTICSEPMDTTADCEVFRPALVRCLAENPLVGLKEYYPVNGCAIEITTNNSAEKVCSYIDEYKNSLPVVFICSAGTDIVIRSENATKMASVISDLSAILKNHDLFVDNKNKFLRNTEVDFFTKPIKVNMSNLDLDEKKPLLKEEPPAPLKKETQVIVKEVQETIKLEDIDYKKVAHKSLGYAHVCFVEEKFINQIGKKVDSEFKNGDVVIVSGGVVINRFEYNSYRKSLDEFRKKLCEIIHFLPKRKTFDFGKAVFHTDARLLEIQEKQSESLSFEEKAVLLSAENESLKKKVKELEQLNVDKSFNSEEYRKALKSLKVLESENEKLKQVIESIQEKLNMVSDAYKATSSVISFYKHKAETVAYFPDDKDDICDWIERIFSDSVIVSPNVRSEIKKYSGDMDIVMLCDGILFLHEYALYRKRKIDKSVLDLYAEYGSWSVEGCGAETLKVFKDEYTVLVNGQKYLLNMHIKYGVNPRMLIRIYFCWDEELKKVIIGHMPSHLATLKQST
ncbi:MAG: hypothetical protein ACI4SF_14120 [Oscillospiraceae bacterium]